MVAREGSRPASAEQRLKEFGIELPTPPEPFGIYAEAVQTGKLLFLTGMLPTNGRAAKFTGHVGAELDATGEREAARLAALNALAAARQHLGSLDRVTRMSGLGSRWLLQEMSANRRKWLMPLRSCCKTFPAKTNPSRLVYGVASLPLGTPVELEVIFEVS